MKPAIVLLLLLFPALPLAAAAPASLHGDFAQTRRLAGVGRPFVSRGRFVLLAGRGLVWRALEPVPASIVLTPRGVFSLDPSGRSRRLGPGGQALKLMGQILAGRFDALGGAFRVVREGDAERWRLKLSPKPGPLARALRSAEVEGSGPLARSADLVSASGDETEVRFLNVAPGPADLTPSEEALLGP